MSNTARTCLNCGRIEFGKARQQCIDCGRSLSLTPRTVDYTPEPARAHSMIVALNDLVPTMTEQAYASFLASSVAAAAYMMLENNSPEVIKHVFNNIIDDAVKQREARARKVNN